ncbi:FAD dependent oxidoreductase TIGR03364 [Gillisia sp. Hel_I_86]|uniref:TIGR03364 family FAD-dependent oxidoreductase n=1 Tax=Gillisia sp. Hel_I_86 TaxID=1249981 RepID=UPI00119C4505|nr:TIGR03364 family FAD-dependent oxidoreductase [Gillisia sp. Hel_I_86]TVZ25855.1 FAD dependent oxidoreductase TIGR03364 [Gillisia sp. Hel_I_86]
MEDKYDLIVVGGGVLGTFHAYHALKKGFRVALIEKDAKPMGATVRNFGQVVPSGMNLKWQAYGRESLRIYKEIQQVFDISLRQNGTVYLASNQEEQQLLEELFQINQRNNYESRLLSKNECLKNYRGLKSSYALAGLYFPQEVTIEPRTMIYKLHRYLNEEYSLHILYNTAVTNCITVNNNVEVSISKRAEPLKAKKVIVCNGNEFKVLFSEIFEKSNIEVTKLQMLQTKPQVNYTLPGSILTGWSIRRYEAFVECPSYQEIKSREAVHSKQKKWGVHILFKQAVDGSIIIGDSHEYTTVDKIDQLGFDLDQNIDNFMLNEAKKIFQLPNFDIQRRWYGLYSQCTSKDLFVYDIDENIHIATAIGGKGMTGSAGFSKENINRILNIK